MEKALELTTAISMLVVCVWMTRAYLRGQQHVVARLGAAVVLLIIPRTLMSLYSDPQSALTRFGAFAMLFALVVMAVGAVRGRFNAPPR